jgi:ABC-type cobalt transport system substrate-binding protein
MVVSGKVIVTTVGITCITLLGIVYFIFVRQDGSVLATLCSAIGGIVGYYFGIAKTKEEK